MFPNFAVYLLSDIVEGKGGGEAKYVSYSFGSNFLTLYVCVFVKQKAGVDFVITASIFAYSGILTMDNPTMNKQLGDTMTLLRDNPTTRQPGEATTRRRDKSMTEQWLKLTAYEYSNIISST